jgi:hypothetical protein
MEKSYLDFLRESGFVLEGPRHLEEEFESKFLKIWKSSHSLLNNECFVILLL